MKKLFLSLLLTVIAIPGVFAKPLYPYSETAKSDIELGVEGIQRLCPTGMWDRWTFRDISFDRESNTVLMVVQLNSWSEERETKVKDMTEAEVQQEANSIVADFKGAYEDLINNPSIQCDGDFMLYLSVGTLLKQMEKDGTNLRIMLLKPDYTNQVFGDIPLKLSSEQLKEVKPKE